MNLDLGRRTFLAATVAAVGFSATCHRKLEAAEKSELAEGPENLFVQAGDRFQFTGGPNKRELLRPEMLEVGARPFEGFPFDPVNEVVRRENRLNRILMLKLDLGEMNDVTRERSTGGIVVYSALCTHRSCTIKSWIAEERKLRCHCHLSVFAALAQGSVLSGPARKQLPMVPLGVDDDGFVIARDGFSGKPGPAKV